MKSIILVFGAQVNFLVCVLRGDQISYEDNSKILNNKFFCLSINFSLIIELAEFFILENFFIVSGMIVGYFTDLPPLHNKGVLKALLNYKRIDIRLYRTRK